MGSSESSVINSVPPLVLLLVAAVLLLVDGLISLRKFLIAFWSIRFSLRGLLDPPWCRDVFKKKLVPQGPLQ